MRSISRDAVLFVFIAALPLFAQQQQTTFDATVAQVLVDVIVTDSDGRFVDDLRQEEFRVYEDGDLQEVTSFQYVDLTREEAAHAAPDWLAPEPVPQEVISAAEVADLSAIVFLIDFPGLDWRNKAEFADAWMEVLDETGSLGIRRAAYLIDQVGQLQELAPLTLDSNLLRNAARIIRETPLVRRGIHEQLVSTGESDIEMSDADRLARSREALRLLIQFCNSLSAREGRTALVWVVSEIQIMEGGPFFAKGVAAMEAGASAPGRRPGTPILRGASQFKHITPDSQILHLQEELRKAANSANVSIYPIDPTPATELISLPMDVQNQREAAEILSSPTVQNSLDALRNVQRRAAADSGGRALIGWTDLSRALYEAENDSKRFYLLTYAAPSAPGDGQYHQVEVQVERSGVSVRARHGYVDLSPEERRKRAVSAAMALPGTVSDLPVSAKAWRRFSSSGAQIIQLAVDLEGVLRERLRRRWDVDAFTLLIRAAAVADDGRVADEFSQLVRPQVDPTRMASSSARSLTYLHDWSLPPGRYSLRVIVQESVTGRLGAAQVPVDLPVSTGGWSTSDLILFVSENDDPAAHLMGHEISATDVLHAYLEVVSGEKPTLSGSLVDAESERLVATLPPVHMVEDDAGVHRGELQLRGHEPGEYKFRLQVFDSLSKRRRVFEQPLRIVAAGLPPSAIERDDAHPPFAREEARESDSTETAALSMTLDRLARVAELYEDQTLSFAAEETVEDERPHDKWPYRRTRRFRFEYIYGHVEEEDVERIGDTLPGTYIDYRREVGTTDEDLTPDEIIERYQLPGLINRAYSFPLLFRSSVQPFHHYEVVGEDEIIGRPALVVIIAPRPPYRLGVNYWFGNVWVDEETFQPLKFEVYGPEDFGEYQDSEAAMRGESGARSYTFTRVTVLFGVKKNGMRFPSEVEQLRRRIDVAGTSSARRKAETRVFRIVQRYSDYRFFSVRTEEEIKSLVLGRKGGSP